MTLVLLFVSIITKAQTEQIDKVELIDIIGNNYDSLVYVVHSTINGCADNVSIEYIEISEGILKVNILYTQIEQTDSYCSYKDTIKIKNYFVFEATVEVNICFEENCRLVGTQEIDVQAPTTSTQINFIKLVKVTADSLEFVVCTTINGGADGLDVQYIPGNNTIKVNILYTQINLADCYCLMRATVKIKKNAYQKAIVEVNIHKIPGGIEPGYYGFVDIREIDLSNFNNINAANNSPVYSKISVFPNPVRDLFYVDLGEYKTANLEIYSIQGNLLLNKNITSKQGIDVSFLSSGLYFVVIDKEHTYKIIKE